MQTVASEDFQVPVDKVLQGASDLVTVVIAGIDANGDYRVASSVGTPQTIDLLRRAQPHIESL